MDIDINHLKTFNEDAASNIIFLTLIIFVRLEWKLLLGIAMKDVSMILKGLVWKWKDLLKVWEEHINFRTTKVNASMLTTSRFANITEARLCFYIFDVFYIY